MLKNISNDLLYLLNILNSAEKIRFYSQDYNNPEAFYETNEQLNFNASLNLLANIGENVNKLSDELKSKYGQIEWSKIISYRHRIVHDYKSVDIFITFEIIKGRLPDLILMISRTVREQLNSGVFNKEEYLVASKSDFYKFVDFKKITL